MGVLVYEMVWDCRYCGAKKLLGLTHRHCPNCGAEQDPNARYFPADNEKVAVQNHEYVGADVVCRYCGGASSKRAHNCGQCGAGLAEGAPVQPLAVAPAGPQGLVALPSAPAPRATWKVVVPILLLATVAVIVLLLLYKKEQGFVAVGHSWRRSIAVERMGPVRESAWCDALPAGSSEVARRREQHGSKQVPDGEECHAHKKDQGDGTFTEEQVCSPKFKNEPAYADKCDFVLVKWSKARDLAADGAADTVPSWPAVTLTQPGCSAAGCEREGARNESYVVTFRDEKGASYRCDFAENVWSSFVDGKRYRGELRALVGSLDCSSLNAAR